MGVEWSDVTQFIDAGVLVVIFFLFAKGVIVSKATMEEIKKTFSESLEQITRTFESTIARINENNNNNVKQMCDTFSRNNDDLKEIINILKERRDDENRR